MAVTDRTERLSGETTLALKLESPLPASLPAGGATGVFISGVCFDRAGKTDLTIVVDGVRHRPAATAMPRPDVLALDGDRRSYRSGWWSTVPITAQADRGFVELHGAVRTAGGLETVTPLGRIEVLAPESDVLAAGVGPAGVVAHDTIAICMTTYNPEIALFREQLASLTAQTDERWVCVISDDCSDPEHFEQIVEMAGSDPRFTVSRSERRLGFYRNFERALRLAPGGARLLALCDQDDRWHPDKLAVLRSALGDAALVYSDQRLVDADGRLLRDTMWRGRRNNFTNLASLLIANTITGAAILFRRDVAESAIPFPDSPGLEFHDHWLALVALAKGDIAYIDRPLYDYVQHAGAVFGEVTQNQHRSRPRRWRAAYFCGYLNRAVQAETLLLRCDADLTPGKRRTLERYLAAERSPAAFLWLLLRPMRTLAGRNETLGSELDLAVGLLWRRLIVIFAKLSEMSGMRLADATFPDPLGFEQRRIRRWRART